jgi:hypothetical protein
MFEHKTEPMLSPRAFAVRLVRGVLVGTGIIALSLGVGMAGYRGFEGLAWLDAFLNAAMLLGGMGPVATPVTEGGKLFAGFYALYCGLVVLAVAGIMLAPIAHRILHRLHLEEESAGRDE